MKVLFFSADWCKPCKAFLPEVEAACTEQGVPLVMLDVIENTRETQKYSVKSVPTVIILKGDEILFRVNNAMPHQHFTNMLNQIGG